MRMHGEPSLKRRCPDSQVSLKSCDVIRSEALKPFSDKLQNMRFSLLGLRASSARSV